jgi:hypothetical protein
MALSAAFTPQTRAQIRAQLTPPSGGAQEAIWHQWYDTQTYVSATTTRLTFFQAVQASDLSNMEVAGMLSAPQSFSIYNVTADFWTAVGVSTSATTAGNANDLFLLMSVGRPKWTLNISGKRYGPYDLKALHASGGPVAFLGTAIATPGSMQFAKNDASEGWNYRGRVGIPEQTAFNIEVVWGAVQTLTANWSIMLSLFGVLNRRVL